MFNLKNRNKLIGILLFLILNIPLAAVAVEDVPKIVTGDEMPILVLPEILDDYIKENYTDVRVPTSEDMAGEWALYSGKQIVPYACWGDFNSDALTDVALIVIEGERWWIQVFYQTADYSYEVVLIDRFPGSDERFTSIRDNPPQGYKLYTLKAGEKVSVEGFTRDASLEQFDTILLSTLGLPLEEMQVIQYYWSQSHNLFGVTRFGFRGFGDHKK